MVKKMASRRIHYAYLAEQIKRLHDVGESYRAMAVRYGTSHAHLNNIANHRAKADDKVARAHARLYFGGSLDDLHREALVWFELNPNALRRAIPEWMGAPLRHPRMYPALLLAFDDDVDPAFVKAFAEKEHTNGDAFRGSQWWAKIQAAYADYAIARSDTVIRSSMAAMDDYREAPPTPSKLASPTKKDPPRK